MLISVLIEWGESWKVASGLRGRRWIARNWLKRFHRQSNEECSLHFKVQTVESYSIKTSETSLLSWIWLPSISSEFRRWNFLCQFYLWQNFFLQFIQFDFIENKIKITQIEKRRSLVLRAARKRTKIEGRTSEKKSVKNVKVRSTEKQQFTL